MQRGGQMVLRMLANVQQKTIQPIIEAAVAKGTRIYTDEYDIYARLDDWGYPMIRPEAVPPGLRDHIERAIDACPTLALHLRR